MGRKPNTDARRQQIVEALMAEMAVAGYERASTKSIAARAGLAPGLIHYHFASKVEILLALVDFLIERASLQSAAALDAAGSPQAKLAAYVASRVGLGPAADSAQVKAWVGILAEAMGQPGVRSRLAKWLGGDHAALAELFAAAGSTAAKEHASMLIAMILGSFSLHALNVSTVPKGYAERQIVLWLDSVVPLQARARIPGARK